MSGGVNAGPDRARRCLLGASLGAMLLAACGRDAPAPSIAPARFPALALQDLAGAPVRLAVPLERPALVNFWATWCAPCREEMASLEALSLRTAAELQVIGVSVDEDRNLVREFLRKQRVTFPIYLDPGSRAARARLAVSTLPETFLLAADGRVLARTRGARRWDGAEVIGELLETLRAGVAIR